MTRVSEPEVWISPVQGLVALELEEGRQGRIAWKGICQKGFFNKSFEEGSRISDS